MILKNIIGGFKIRIMHTILMAAIKEPVHFTLKDFQALCKSQWAAINKENKGRNIGKNPQHGAERIFAIYFNTFNAPLPFVLLGLDRIRDDRLLRQNFGLITEKTEGAILGENPWSQFINDGFVLGASHARKEVFVLISNAKGKIWDVASERLTILGRELAILQIAGYRRVQSEKGVMAFLIQKDAPLVSLEQLWVGLKKVSKLELEQFCAQIS